MPDEFQNPSKEVQTFGVRGLLDALREIADGDPALRDYRDDSPRTYVGQVRQFAHDAIERFESAGGGTAAALPSVSNPETVDEGDLCADAPPSADPQPLLDALRFYGEERGGMAWLDRMDKDGGDRARRAIERFESADGVPALPPEEDIRRDERLRVARRMDVMAFTEQGTYGDLFRELRVELGGGRPQGPGGAVRSSADTRNVSTDHGSDRPELRVGVLLEIWHAAQGIVLNDEDAQQRHQRITDLAQRELERIGVLRASASPSVSDTGGEPSEAELDDAYNESGLPREVTHGGDERHEGLRLWIGRPPARPNVTGGPKREWGSWALLRDSVHAERAREAGWEVVEVMPVAETGSRSGA